MHWFLSARTSSTSPIPDLLLGLVEWHMMSHLQSHRIPQKFLSAMEWLEKGGMKSHQLWQTFLHASLQCTGRTASLLMHFISLLLPTLASLAKTCQDLVAFLPLSLWTHAVFWFNEGNSAENADKRKILIQLRPLARYKWRGQWDRAGAPRRGISGDWSHARWEPRALCRGLLRTWIERNPLCVRDAQADWCNSINFSFWHFLSAVFSVCIVSCINTEKSQPFINFFFFFLSMFLCGGKWERSGHSTIVSRAWGFFLKLVLFFQSPLKCEMQGLRNIHGKQASLKCNLKFDNHILGSKVLFSYMQIYAAVCINI